MTTNPLQAPLKSLLPSTTAIPPHLLSAATSLLSFSRQRAANLKPDEEIARTHACAEIACKRLRAHLRLPNIKSGNGAPCRPAVYKRLLTFLEGVLADVDLLGTPQKAKRDVDVIGTGRQKTPTTGGKSTGRKRVIEDLAAEDEEDVDMVETPTKKRKVAGGTPVVTPTKSTAKKANGFLGRIQASTGKTKGKGKDAEAEAPEYVLPAVRNLCKAFKTPKMVPHVYTGVCVTIDLANLLSSADTQNQTQGNDAVEVQDDLKIQHLCLMLAAFAVTLTRMHQGEITQETFDAVTERGLAIIGLNDESETLKTKIEEWIGKITVWVNEAESAMNWIDSIPLDTLAPFKLPKSSLPNGQARAVQNGLTDVVEVGHRSTSNTKRHPESRMSRREEIRKELEKEDPDDILLPGLGTMVHDAVDYLSAERIAEYAEWKAGMLQQIETIERGTGISPRKRQIAT